MGPQKRKSNGKINRNRNRQFSWIYSIYTFFSKRSLLHFLSCHAMSKFCRRMS